jgi:hypothetical protein
MSQYIATRFRKFECGGSAIAAYLRVTMNSSKQLVVAGVDDLDIGTTFEYCATQGVPYPVDLATGQGTHKMTAAGAITAGAFVYAAASGKISSAVGPVFIGLALEAASGSGSVLEVLRLNGLKMTGGSTVLGGSSPTAIVTGLSTILYAAASLQIVGGAAPGLDPCQLAVDWGGSVAAGTLDVYAYKFTSSSNPTLLASTNASDYISWVALGV